MKLDIKMDKIETFHGALIQHGSVNNRIYLMDLGDADPKELTGLLNKLALKNNYSKIFAKIPKSLSKNFIDEGYNIEASIPMFYNDSEEVLFLGKYFSLQASKLNNKVEAKQVLKTALSRSKEYSRLPALKSINFRICKAEDAIQMSKLYSSVFETYPFPIYDPAYIKKTMDGNIVYFAAEFEGKLIALSAAEIDSSSKSAEMTDFATHPKWRGNSLSLYLLTKMEEEMSKLNIKTVYTIARALSPAMNISFSRMGYNYAGTLINNTNIGGQIESMNVWYKNLPLVLSQALYSSS